ncbi:MAG: hypothetical protein ACKOAF_00050, partial [Actinomycetes bacterium]
QVLRTASNPSNTSAQFYVPAATTALAMLTAAIGIPALLRSANVVTSRLLPWLVGLASLALAFVPWLLLGLGNASVASWMYVGTHVPQGQIRFWDLSLVLQSLDCDRLGFDVFVANNGCLADAAIYGPGVLWLNRLPFSVFSLGHLQALGVVAMVASSLALVWLARFSSGLGQITLLAAALGAPWLLLLERGNIDAVIIWVAVLVVIAVRRWDRLWAWFIAAGAIWLLGTWKYYPFALGLMLIPVLRLRRGWTVLLAYALASLAFVLATWDNFRFSSQSNSNMVDFGDVVVLGRIPVVARMVGTHVGQSGLQFGDFVVYALALAALIWGVGFGLRLSRRRVHAAMLAASGSSVYLAAVLIAGFGWAYKATFLLLCVPLLALRTARSRLMLFSSVTMLALTAISSIVVWNTLLATSAGVIVGAFSLGAAVTVLVRGSAAKTA